MTYALKRSMKVGGTEFPKGTELRGASTEEMQKIWPSIKFVSDSSQTGVWFPNMTKPTIVHSNHVKLLE